MNKFFLSAISVLLFQVAVISAADTVDSVNVAPFGRVYVYNPNNNS